MKCVVEGGKLKEIKPGEFSRAVRGMERGARRDADADADADARRAARHVKGRSKDKKCSEGEGKKKKAFVFSRSEAIRDERVGMKIVYVREKEGESVQAVLSSAQSPDPWPFTQHIHAMRPPSFRKFHRRAQKNRPPGTVGFPRCSRTRNGIGQTTIGRRHIRETLI
jgi:hypothetical protein